ncbi:hypothetical protein EW145_g4639 [Phellinidium pouzarii]|uniref:Cytochrome P450 n=1 Tax=Phellinidium pouzarii TaxID=167371 RepID=A0A4V6S160_9AGAM|nr:hypothetical protein EW145_g4639 [Phellinidium pouzarii]
MDVFSALHNIKMIHLSLRDTVIIDVASALLVHLIYKRYEFDASRLIISLLLLVVIPSIPAAFFVPHFSGSTFLAFLSSFTIFYLVLISSIAAYRLSPWHPLAQYPGPILAKLTKFWGTWMMATGRNHIHLKQMHDAYGPYVRIGPNELSIVDASVISSVLGSEGMPKGPMWSGRMIKNSTPSLLAMRSAHAHAARRKPWNRAFNSAAVKGYEPIVIKRGLQLVRELEKRTSGVDLAEWISFFTTDFMGDMAFGGGFELMRDGGDKEGVWSTIEDGMEFLAVIQHLPWLSPLLFIIPGAMKNVYRFRTFCRERVQKRKAHGSLSKDLFYHLIDEDHIEKTPPSTEVVISDGGLAIVAGSDTTATVLSGIFFFLLTNPSVHARLQQEIDAAFPLGEGEPFDATKLAEMSFLNAVINETLRLQPPVPTYLQRAPEEGSGGKWIGDRFIPEGTAVVIPPYVISRDSRYFSPAPDSFWPERWLHPSVIRRTPKQQESMAQTPYSSTLLSSPTLNPDASPDVITNTAAFIPFSYGPANCAGRALAQTEMRMIVALLMQHFSMRFADGYDPRDWEAHIEDWFTVKKGKLHVVLTPRV